MRSMTFLIVSHKYLDVSVNRADNGKKRGGGWEETKPWPKCVNTSAWMREKI